MSYEVAPGSFDSLEDEWRPLLPSSATRSVFLTPSWQRTWWNELGTGQELLLSAVRLDGVTIGILPLMREGRAISFIGDESVCDYHDFVVRQGMAEEFYTALARHLDELQWDTLRLSSLREDSPTLSALPALAESRGWRVEKALEEVCPAVQLPADWDSYINMLGKKDRHELRRKLRRLYGAGEVSYYAVENPQDIPAALETFIELLKASREDKAQFMTADRERFFRTVASVLSKEGLLKLFFLDVQGRRAASCMCFDYDGTYSLYNSGYDPAFSELSAGLLLKALCLKDAIEHGRGSFDFLRGAESYKYHLGGKDLRLYRLAITRR